MHLHILLVLVCTMQVITAHCQDNWKLTRHQNGIKVYTADEPSSAFKAVKVEAVLAGTLQGLYTILMDVDHNKRWVYKTRHSHLIQKINPYEVLYYAETALPWPLSNRDMAIRMQFDLDTARQTLKVMAKGAPEAIPEVSGLVRVRKFDAVWEVTVAGQGQIRIHYFLRVNPGGNIPAAVSNVFVSKGPWETFNNLSRLLMK